LGFIAQNGMKTTRRRLAEGRIKKTQSGHVTAKKNPTFGYRLDTTDEARKDNHYAINDAQAEIVRYIYEQYASGKASLSKIGEALNSMYPLPGDGKRWNADLIRNLIQNPVYRGELVANSFQKEKCSSSDEDSGMDDTGQIATRKVERNPSESVIVPVPAIVSPDLWEAANRRLDSDRGVGKGSNYGGNG